ncbi:hypothetical protein H8B13_04525 [Hymenobacter sp. BT188]|uniref:hypothetical protein n=1 Tax=Hymenobacter sp. BT188 TaxID=2763504 RepID=UPI0016517E27|nr:hypothetical protein [Hymenobacter sp. BT188]MBC6606077.1 hypothetical protein [Hymenobacter sp. BT188]
MLLTFLRPAMSWVVAILSGVLLLAAQSVGPVPPIRLLAPTQTFAPQEFYVAQVIDERPDRRAVASLIPPATATTTAPAPKPQAVDLQGGGGSVIQKFIQQTLPANKQLRPITIRLRECKVTETSDPKAPSRVDGRITIKMAFDWQRDGQTIALTEYQGAARYGRPAGQLGVVEPTLRQALTEAMRYLHTWVKQNAPHNAKLATGVQVFFTDYTDNQEADTLFYDPKRPLDFADFKGTRQSGGNTAAVIFPNFAYQGATKVVGGKMQLHIAMKTFVVRSSSWVADHARTPYTLNHEQRHFDVVKLVVERFKQRIRQDTLSVDYYAGHLQYQYLLSYQEMNRMQEQYDGETGNGTNDAAQARWNERITKELQAFGVVQ